MRKRLLVVGAHSADFVWRAAGAVARHTSAGGEALVVALSYGERGESGELWKVPGQTEKAVKGIRQKEATTAAAAVGAQFECLDLGDYPLRVDGNGIDRLAAIIRDFRPLTVVTHSDGDPFNPDHPEAHRAVALARLLTSGSGVASAFDTVQPTSFWAFEPHQPEVSGFVPTAYVDITSVIDSKKAAMEAMEAQSYLRTYYLQRAEHRANHARKVTGDSEIRYAEAFQQLLPRVIDELT